MEHNTLDSVLVVVGFGVVVAAAFVGFAVEPVLVLVHYEGPVMVAFVVGFETAIAAAFVGFAVGPDQVPVHHEGPVMVAVVVGSVVVCTVGDSL